MEERKAEGENEKERERVRNSVEGLSQIRVESAKAKEGSL